MFKLCVLYFLSAAFLNAQLPNDCSGALVVCDDSTLNLDALGTGVQELSGTNDCNSAENNSIWLKINIQNSGTFGFILTPNSTNIAIDYDFFLYGPDVDCGAIGKAIRCSTTNPAMANMSHNQTGMNSSEIDLSEGPGMIGNSFVRELNVLAGESYFLVIDRPIGMSPFSLEWTGSATLPPLPTNPIQKSDMDMDFCDSKFPYGDGITEIDLTDRTRQIMNSQNDVIVSYHLSESDANLSNRPLGNVFDNVGNPQKIYMKIQNTITGCYRIDEFEIHVDRVKILPEFSTIETICAGTDFRLPTISKNNITGTWAPPFDTTKTTKYTFTPDPGQCAKNTELTINITKKIVPVFDPIRGRVRGGPSSLSPPNNEFQTLSSNAPLYTVTALSNPNKPSLTRGASIRNKDDKWSKVIDLGFEFCFFEKSYDKVIIGTNGVVSFEIENAKEGNDNDWELGHNEFIPNASSETFSEVNIFGVGHDIIPGNRNTKYYTIGTAPNRMFVVSFNEVPHYDCLSLKSTTQIILYESSNIIDINIYKKPVCYGHNYGLAVVGIQNIDDTIAFTPPNRNTSVWTATNEFWRFTPSSSKITPIFGPIPDVCEGTLITLPTTSKNGVTGTWSPAFDPNNTTTYTFTPNTGQCATNANIEVGIISKKVLSISAKITTETFAKSPEIKVTLKERKGQYEYQLNNENWQESPIFSGIVGCKKHTIRVRELGGCSRPGMTSITVMDFPKFFTPNGDGYNDNWTINCLKNKITSISIFDRYGKLIKQLSAGDIGWDGTYQGVRLPSSDYWFIIAYKEDGVEKQFKSHFSLKR